MKSVDNKKDTSKTIARVNMGFHCTFIFPFCWRSEQRKALCQRCQGKCYSN